MPRLNARKKTFGFTLIELLVIMMISGILSAITIPSFLSAINRVHLNNAVTEVRSALRTGQREAIRRSQVCTVGLNTVERTVTSYCLGNNSNLPNPVAFVSNIRKDFNLSGNPIKIDFGILGTAEFTIAENEQNSGLSQNLSPTTSYLETSWQQSPALPTDPSGKIVLYTANKPNLTKKCIAISNILGLTRVGNYIGNLTNTQISRNGSCTTQK